jgi:hypothetical protein
LSAARKRFADGLVDEQSGHYAVALEEFQRVQRVRDTQAVRYRIATCLEALGRLKQALAAYESTSIATADAESVRIAQASRDRIAAIETRLARLVINGSAGDGGATVVTVDGEAVPPNALGTPLVVDPSSHEIVATRMHGNVVLFRKTVTLPEGGDVTVDITLPPDSAGAATPSPSPSPGTANGEQAPSEPAPRGTNTHTTVGLVALGAGGVLVLGAVALLLARQSDIQSLDAACPGGTCAAADEASLTGTRNRALVEGPLAIGAGCVGVIGVGIGIYLLALKPANHAPAQALLVSPWMREGGEGAALSGRF